MKVESVKRGMDSAIGAMSPETARRLARDLTTPGAAKEQIARLTADLIERSQAARAWATETIRREVSAQMKTMGLATQDELDALRKRVRRLEREIAHQTAASRKRSTSASSTKTKTTSPSSASRTRSASGPTAAEGGSAKSS